MSAHTPASARTPARRRNAVIAATAVALPLVAAVPSAEAAPCRLPEKLTCAPRNTTGGSGGGSRGPAGGGGGGGPVAPPPPEGLNDNEAIGVVPVNGGPAPAAAPPSTAQLVEEALSAKAFPVPVVHTAPKGKTYVRMRTSLWVDGFDVVRTDPVSAGAQTVQATAQPTAVDWDLGEKRLTCADGGSKAGTTCHYTYRRSSAGKPGGSYKITATVRWHVTWTCAGADCDAADGDLGERTETSPPVALVVSEIQTNTGQ
ncbi:hypothetical protein AGRA3207_005842 [Actinomadura graeca]|uniref:Uncharacterized protein n=1 Tax=Actinomadura graeca TaxID=2750812 RepID=A0ABX8R469_9ACTN|nr:hypothetical protein [Actinomadura graeca]QXJ24507.1 hypothetical protein AGRA3207_005842 [Actinomadura graeca]